MRRLRRSGKPIFLKGYLLKKNNGKNKKFVRYVKNRSHFSQKKKSSGKGCWIVAVALIGIIAIVAFWLLKQEESDEVMELLSDEVVEKQESHPEEPQGDEGSSSWTQEVVLTDVEGTGGSGVSRRGVAGDLFTHVIVADLPAIETETTYYEGWLVVPGVTDFFSTGEMFAREDGKWGLVWESKVLDAPDNLFDYREVVITREQRDGDDTPSPAHVLEGRFE